MSSALVAALRDSEAVLSVELRPPRAELDAAAGRDAWIDTYHAVRGLVRDGTFVFLTDSAVGAREEHNLRHLVINLGTDVPRDRVPAPRVQPRESGSKFCWQCHKPLPARTDRCPFCGETQ